MFGICEIFIVKWHFKSSDKKLIRKVDEELMQYFAQIHCWTLSATVIRRPVY